MLPSGLLSVLVAVTVLGCVQAQGNYLVLCPNVFRPGYDYIVQVSNKDTQDMNIMVKLAIDGQPAAPNMQQSSRINANTAGSLTLQISTAVTKGTYSLTVEGRTVAGNELTFTNSTPVQLEMENALILIQLDKPIYKPMQTVRFRAITVDQDLKPMEIPTDISIMDGNNNKLDQWLNKTSTTGVVAAEYELSDLPPFGSWKIMATNRVAQTSKDFSVEKYVLPKFEVKVEVIPGYISRRDQDDFTVRVSAKYTYGKSVQGDVRIVLSGSGLKSTILVPGKLSASEEYKDFTFKTSEVMTDRGYSSWYRETIMINVNVTEDPARVTEQAEEVIMMVYPYNYKLEFASTSAKVYRPGLPLPIVVKVTNPSGTEPAKVGEVVDIEVGFSSGTQEKSLEIGADGTITTEFEVPEKQDQSLRVTATLKTNKDVSSSVYLNLFRTQLKAGLRVEVTDSQPLTAGQSFSLEIKTSQVMDHVVYLVLARGRVITSGQINMGGQKSKTETIQATKAMTPDARIVVYGIVNGSPTPEVIADSVSVIVDDLFSNTVELSFSTGETRAGSTVDVTVTSERDSYFCVLALDMSVQLLGDGNDLSQGEVKNMMGRFALDKTRTETGPEEHHGGGPELMDAMIWPPGGGSDEPSSAGEVLKKRGLKILTNLLCEDTRPREIFPVMAMADDRMMESSAVDDSAPQNSGPAEETAFAELGATRKSFPEAWLWKDGTIGASGRWTHSETVPDTITTWKATAFALHSTNGLAITTRSTDLKVFQPFFASLTLPYSIRRGETFELKVSIFNYMDTSTEVSVILYQSDDFGVNEENAEGQIRVVSKNITEKIVVQKNKPGLVKFMITPNKLGQVPIHVSALPEESTGERGDDLIRNVLVKPEGITTKKTASLSISLNTSSTSFEKAIPILFPEGVVPGSRRIEIQGTGDVMGPSIEGLESLVGMPTGCGEQNMIGFVPNIVVHSYLTAVNRDTPELLDKTIKFMKIGYQRELQYRLNDGSFSAFGESDKIGSTWLTAFVMKSFAQAKKYITIEAGIMKAAFDWMKPLQQNDGTFDKIGRVIHQEMFGGSDGKRAFTAFVYIALMEAKDFIPAEDRNMLDKTKNYLEQLVTKNELADTYEMAIVLYALALSDSNKVNELYTKINNKPKPWEQTEGTQIKATAIEAWSYVLLGLVRMQRAVEGRLIMKWLIGQQNDRGGMMSTQDTIIGIQALAEIAAVLYNAPQTDIVLKVTTSGSKVHTFDISKSDLLLLHKEVLSPDTTYVSVTATGFGLAVFKVNWQYNLKKGDKKGGDKTIDASVTTEKINEELYNIRGCFKSQHDLGMTTMTVSLPTQHVLANKEALESRTTVMRIEDENSHVNLYFDGTSPTDTCVDVMVQRVSVVDNLQDAEMEVVAYYQPDVVTKVEYSLSDAQQIDICLLCVGQACPSRCTTNGATTWRTDSIVLAAIICVLTSFIMAM